MANRKTTTKQIAKAIHTGIFETYRDEHQQIERAKLAELLEEFAANMEMRAADVSGDYRKKLLVYAELLGDLSDALVPLVDEVFTK